MDQYVFPQLCRFRVGRVLCHRMVSLLLSDRSHLIGDREGFTVMHKRRNCHG